MAHRARLSGSQTRGRARAFRRARLAWLPPPRYAVHRGLRIPGLREGDDSPLGISFHQAVQETCGFQRLPTQRLRHCDPNVTSRTRLRRCDEDSSLPSPGTSHAVPVAFGNRSVFFCDAVRLGAANGFPIPRRCREISTLPMTIDLPDDAASNARYAYKASLVGAARQFELTDAGLAWRVAGKSDVWPYRAISRIRLSYRPVSMQSHRFRADIEHR